MKLEIELIPRTSFYDNVRSAVSRQRWDEIRTEAYAKYDHKCGICERKPKKPLEAHEIWEFDDERGTQTLTGIIALCSLCHKVKHIGLSELLASQGKMNLAPLVAHFCRVNNCDGAAFMRHRNEQFELWDARSHREWSVDISWLDKR